MILLIGDIQGCDEPLQQLLDVTGFSPSRDRLVILGDMVNRGPQSLAVLQRLMAFGSSATCLLGNHDLHLLAVSQGVRKPHRQDTLGELLTHLQAPALLEWLRCRPLLAQAEGWLCVHAGIPAEWTLADTWTHAQEVQAVLSGPDWVEWLHSMYGNEPARWQAELSDSQRRRFTVNALTRMRLCQPDGTLDFSIKEGLAEVPEGFVPWFDLPGRLTAETPIAFGHWSTLGLLNRPALLGLDTGCVWGGALTAARVDGGRQEIIAVACKGFQKPG